MEVYYSDQKPNVYNIQATAVEANATNTGLDANYIKTFPSDPTGTNPYMYMTDAAGANYAVFCALENTNDGDIKTANPTAGTMPTNYNYWVEND